MPRWGRVLTGFYSCRSTILLESKSLLRGRVVSDQAIAEALVAAMLLEDSSPRQALADFLLARKASVHQLLNQPQHGISPSHVVVSSPQSGHVVNLLTFV